MNHHVIFFADGGDAVCLLPLYLCPPVRAGVLSSNRRAGERQPDRLFPTGSVHHLVQQ